MDIHSKKNLRKKERNRHSRDIFPLVGMINKEIRDLRVMTHHLEDLDDRPYMEHKKEAVHASLLLGRAYNGYERLCVVGNARIRENHASMR